MPIKTVTNDDLLNLVASYNLSSAAEAYTRETLLAEPSREVGQNARRNVTGAFCSPSQGRTIQYESHTAEYTWLLRWELDPEIVGFRDQPPMVQIKKADKNGVQRTTTYTPDFLVLRFNEVFVVEVKTEVNLLQLAEKYPEQWQCSNGTWRYLPAEEVFREKGLVYKVLSVDTTQSIETNNYKTLLHAHRMVGDVSTHVSSKLVAALDESAWLSVRDLQTQVPESTYADIYLLILNRQLFADLTQLLTDVGSCVVSSDPSLLSVMKECRWQAPAVPGFVSTSLIPGKAELEKALVRLERVNSDEQSRHVRRLRKRVQEQAAYGNTPLQALIMPRKGNSDAKIPTKVRDCALEHISSKYMCPTRPTLHAAWTNYRNWARRKHSDFNPVSLTTYRKFVAQKSSEDVAYSRGGKRAGNAAASTTPVLDRALIATRPFERFPVDHTKLDILVKVFDCDGTEYLLKPWLSVLFDEYSDNWVSFFLTFRDPSKRSLSMLFRNCVREYGRLPEHVHSDRGSDFRSVFYRNFTAHYGVTVDWSPAGHSRYNAGAERVFKQLKDQWITHRPGNTVDYIETRKYSKGYRPQDQASISIDDLFLEIDAFRNLYNQTIVGTNSETPEQLFRSGLDSFGFSGIPVTVDDSFLLATAFDTDKSDYKISPAGEIVYNQLHFHHPELRRLQPKRNRTELRIDPEDPFRIYCKVEGNWITALNAKHKKFVAKAPMARWAETLRVAEGRPLRDDAKQSGHDKKALVMKEFDNGYQEKSGNQSRIIENAAAVNTVVVKSDNDSTDIFERLKSEVLAVAGAKTL